MNRPLEIGEENLMNNSATWRNQGLASLAVLWTFCLLLLAGPVSATGEPTSAEDAYRLGVSFQLTKC